VRVKNKRGRDGLLKKSLFLLLLLLIVLDCQKQKGRRRHSVRYHKKKGKECHLKEYTLSLPVLFQSLRASRQQKG
jgi:hypothetical protein